MTSGFRPETRALTAEWDANPESLRKMLRESGGNLRGLARTLGISRETLTRKVAALGLKSTVNRARKKARNPGAQSATIPSAPNEGETK